MKIKQFESGLLSRCSYGIAIALLSLTAQMKPAHSAEKVKLIYGPFSGKISVASLAQYAATGEITGEFRMYSKFVDRETLKQPRYWLNSRFESDRVAMYRFSRTSEGDKFFKDLGTVIKTHPQRNGYLAIRSALIEAADVPQESDGWTALEAMQNFPTEDLQINTKDLFKLQKSWSKNQESNQATLAIFKRRDSTSAKR